jgi:hypothetical protein
MLGIDVPKEIMWCRTQARDTRLAAPYHGSHRLWADRITGVRHGRIVKIGVRFPVGPFFQPFENSFAMGRIVEYFARNRVFRKDGLR